MTVVFTFFVDMYNIKLFFHFFSVETSESNVQAVLIDCSSVTFVDVAGARLFTQVSLKRDIMLQTSLHFFVHCVNIIDRYWLFADVYWMPESWSLCIFGKLQW